MRLPDGKSGQADIALNRVNRLYGIERRFKEVGDEHRLESRQQNNLSLQLQAWLVKIQPRVTRLTQCANGLRLLVSLQVHRQ